MTKEKINRLSEIISELSLQIPTVQAGKLGNEAQAILLQEEIENPIVEIAETIVRVAIRTVEEAESFCTNKAVQAKLRILRETLQDHLPEALKQA